MKRHHLRIMLLILSLFLVSCAHYPPDRYNTQRGAVIGGGAGALIGQAIGRNTESTLIGLAAGTIVGALVGNAMDQDYQAARDAARYNKPVIYYDKHGAAVEAIPEPVGKQTNCREVTKRIWQDGELISETVEEICEDRDRYGPQPYYVYPNYPRFYFHYGYFPRPPYVYPYYRHPHRHRW